VIVPLSERPYLLRRWASAVGEFTALDLDCSLPPLFSSDDLGESEIFLEPGDVLTAVEDVFALPKLAGPLVVNSLGTLQAIARASGGERDWSRRFFKYLVYLTVACKARAGSSLFLVNAAREGGVKALLGAGWVRLCSGSLDGTWMLSEDGLTRVP